MKCSHCGTEAASPYCPNCGAAMPQSTAVSGDPPAISVLRKHAASGLMLAVILLMLVNALFQMVRVFTGNGALFTLSLNGEVSALGSAICTLLLFALFIVSFWKLYSAAKQAPGNRLPTAPATVAKIFSVIGLVFACLLVLGAIALPLAVAVPGSNLLEQISGMLEEKLPLEEGLDASGILITGMVILAVMGVLELISTISLVRTVSKAKRMLRSGAGEKLSKLTAVTLLINAGLLALSLISTLSGGTGIWDLVTNLLLAALLVCFALLIFRARADLEQSGVPGAGPEQS